MPSTTDPDFELLLANPQAFLLKSQDLITSLVWRFVSWGLFTEDEVADLIQTVNLGLLERVESIRRNYNHSTLLRTYLTTIIRNICLQHRKKENRGKRLLRPLTDEAGSPREQLDRHSVAQSKVLFAAVLKQYGSSAPKLTICLKLRFRQPVTRKDLQNWWPRCRKVDAEKFLSLFGVNFDKLTDLEVYAAATPFFNAAEGKVNTDDTLRRWTVKKIEEFRQILNKAVPGAAFNEESLSLLFEDSISPFLLQD